MKLKVSMSLLQNFCYLNKSFSIDPSKGGIHGVSLNVQMSNSYFAEGHDFIDEQNFEDNGQITAIQLRAGSENIYAIRARLITLPYFRK